MSSGTRDKIGKFLLGNFRERERFVSESKKNVFARKAKDAGDLAINAGVLVVDVWRDLNEKTRQGIEKSYQAKRPLAIAKIEAIRYAAPKGTPADAQIILDRELNTVETKKGVLSVSYTSAASLYILSSMELRQLDPNSTEAHQKLVNLLVLVDSRAVRVTRRLANVAMWVVPYLKVAKGAKVVTVAAKSAKIAKRAASIKKTLDAAKVVAMPLANVALKDVKKSGRVTSYIIEQTSKILGPTPSTWPVEKPKKSATKTKPKASKK
jgi:hypothetical protein